MTDTKQLYGVYFAEDKEDPFDVIMRILAKNNLKETFNDAADKRAKGKISGIDFLYAAAKNLVLENLTEKDFVLSVQKQLGVSPEVAENLNKDVKLMLLPLAVKEKIGKSQEGEKPEEPPSTFPKIKAPIEVEKIMEERRESLLKEKVIGPTESEVEEPVPAPAKKYSSAKKNATPKEVEKPIVKKSDKPDPYKESIE